jgi:hypothetical protein
MLTINFPRTQDDARDTGGTGKLFILINVSYEHLVGTGHVRLTPTKLLILLGLLPPGHGFLWIPAAVTRNWINRANEHQPQTKTAAIPALALPV